MQGYYEQEKDRQFNVSAYLLRDLILATINGNPYIKENSKPNRASDIMEFPNDAKHEPKIFTSEEIALMAKAWGMA